MAAVLEVRGTYHPLRHARGRGAGRRRGRLLVGQGESLGVVGESGSGKTQIFLSIMGLLAKNGRAPARVRYHGQEILEPAARPS